MSNGADSTGKNGAHPYGWEFHVGKIADREHAIPDCSENYNPERYQRGHGRMFDEDSGNQDISICFLKLMRIRVPWSAHLSYFSIAARMTSEFRLAPVPTVHFHSGWT